MGQQWCAYVGSFQSRHSHALWFNKINGMTEVKLMIRELTLLFSVRVHENWSLPSTFTFRPHTDQACLNGFPLHVLFFFFSVSDIKHGGKMHL